MGPAGEQGERAKEAALAILSRLGADEDMETQRNRNVTRMHTMKKDEKNHVQNHSTAEDLNQFEQIAHFCFSLLLSVFISVHPWFQIPCGSGVSI